MTKMLHRVASIVLACEIISNLFKLNRRKEEYVLGEYAMLMYSLQRSMFFCSSSVCSVDMTIFGKSVTPVIGSADAIVNETSLKSGRKTCSVFESRVI
jgi:hypothetical protein